MIQLLLRVAVGQAHALGLALVLVAVLAHSGTPSRAQSAEGGIFQGALTLYAAAQQKPPSARGPDYANVRAILDVIEQQFPDTPLAAQIAAQSTIDGMNIAALNRALGRPEAGAWTSADPQAQLPGDGTASGQAAVRSPARPEREIVADMQRELTRMGCGAGSADGVIGAKTRRAWARFIEMTGVPMTEEDLVSEDAVQMVTSTSQPVCSARWAAANIPDMLAGSWGYRADCPGLFGRTVRVTGSTTSRMTSSGQYRGSIRDSLGRSGAYSARLQGNRLDVSLTLGGSNGRAVYTLSSKTLTMTGTDNFKCRIVAWKN